MANFDIKKVGLNAKQLAVAQELDKNILLLASAGTGKTNTLSYRIVNILAQGRAKAEEIVCLSFTNKACNEMQERIADVAGKDSHGITVKTFHGFCYLILQWAARQGSDLPADFVVFDETDCSEIIRELDFAKNNEEIAVQPLINLLKEYRGEYNIFTADSVADYKAVFVRLAKEKPQRVLDAAKCRGGDKNRLFMYWARVVPSVVAEYDFILRENHAVDFTDLINGAYRILQVKEYMEYWREQYKYWSVDEVQDTSRLEFAVLNLLFGDSNILMCGDFFQTIYEWRGSEPQLIYDNFCRDYQPVFYVFHENYRATQNLLQASYGYLERSFASDVARLFPEAAVARVPVVGEKISYNRVNSIHAEAVWIYEQLQRIKPKHLSDVCILTRDNKYNKKLGEALGAIYADRVAQFEQDVLPVADFPLAFMLVDDFKFFRREEIKDVIAVLRLLLNPQDNASLKRIAVKFAPNIGKKTVAKIISDEYKELGIRLTDFLHPSTQKYSEPFELLLRSLENNEVVVFDVESTGLDTTQDEIVQLAAIRLDRAGQVVDKLNLLLKASKSVGKAEEVHHISDAMLQEKGLEPREALGQFLDFARGCVIVGHNVTYDLAILSSQLERLGMEQLDYPAFYDTLDIFRRFYPQLPNHKLEFLGEFCQVSHKSSHDAFDDISATAEILMYAIKENILPSRDARRNALDKYVKHFNPFVAKLEGLKQVLAAKGLRELIIQCVMQLEMNEHYKHEFKRMENLRMLVRQSKAFEAREAGNHSLLQKFLQLTALSNTELDTLLDEHPRIPIITVHQAKGLEFSTVFLCGLQENTFPSYIAMKNKTLEEEKRLFYVAITRAKKRLFLSSVEYPRNHFEKECPFIKDIPSQYIVHE